jgi:hypothetical protein
LQTSGGHQLLQQHDQKQTKVFPYIWGRPPSAPCIIDSMFLVDITLYAIHAVQFTKMLLHGLPPCNVDPKGHEVSPLPDHRYCSLNILFIGLCPCLEVILLFHRYHLAMSYVDSNIPSVQQMNK